jgi:hypothetical protein
LIKVDIFSGKAVELNDRAVSRLGRHGALIPGGAISLLAEGHLSEA